MLHHAIDLENSVLKEIDGREKTILDSINEGVFTVDLEWKITSFNRAAEKITHVTRKEALGRQCCDVFRGHWSLLLGGIQGQHLRKCMCFAKNHVERQADPERHRSYRQSERGAHPDQDFDRSDKR